MAGMSSSRLRAPIATFVAALMLAGTGVMALVFQPSLASANVTPGVKPDFTMSVGDTRTQAFSKAIHGSVELKGQPDQCRKTVPYNLTCAAHRLKLNRVAGAPLRIVLEWDAQAANVLSVPDLDMFLYDSATSPLDSGSVGGAGSTAPEQIEVVPDQDEYDIVVQAYAGSVTSYKLTVYYGAPEISTGGGSDEDAPLTPDIVLRPDDAPVVLERTSAIVMSPLITYPDACRNNPEYDATCDVFRVKLNRNLAKGAINYVVISLEWDAVTVPSIQTPATGTVEQYLPNMEMYVFDQPEHYLPSEIGGTSLRLPERVGFIATQDEYDLVINVFEGASTGYKLTAFMTDELFEKPFEVLDPVSGLPLSPAVDPETGVLDPSKLDKSAENFTPALDLAPIDIDNQIAGIGLGTTEQFDREEALRLGQAALRNVSLTSNPPAGWILWLTMLVVPLGFGMFFVILMRRRHNDAF